MRNTPCETRTLADFDGGEKLALDVTRKDDQTDSNKPDLFYSNWGSE